MTRRVRLHLLGGSTQGVIHIEAGTTTVGRSVLTRDQPGPLRIPGLELNTHLFLSQPDTPKNDPHKRYPCMPCARPESVFLVKSVSPDSQQYPV